LKGEGEERRKGGWKNFKERFPEGKAGVAWETRRGKGKEGFIKYARTFRGKIDAW